MDLQHKYKLKKFVRELAGVRGRHTELVSVYVPSGYDIQKIINHLSDEQGTASNIKDKTTRKNVQDSLERMIRHLRLIPKTPPNGLAVFSGNKKSAEGKQDIGVWSIEPSVPLNMRLYRCSQTFVLEPLLEMLEARDTYAIITMDNRDATVGLVRGKKIEVIKQMHSGVPGKFKAGGQSQARFARLREEAAAEFYRRIGNVVNDEFLHMSKDLRGILIGGPGMTKETFANGAYINNQLKEKIIAIKDLSYTNEFGLRELLEKCQDVLAKEEIMLEKKIVNDFLTVLAKESSKAVYGIKDVSKALQFGAVDKLLISEDFDGNIEEFEEKAQETGAHFFIISNETEEGTTLKDLGGITAILRFPIGE